MKNRKHLTINSLAIGNLKQRKKQYTVMIIGIILAMVFSSSIVFFASSMISSIKENLAVNYGMADKILIDADEKIIDEAKERKLIGESGYAHVIGYAYTDKNDEINGTAIAWLDDDAKKLANPVLIEGKYPEKSGEIAIESTALLKLGIKAEVGDKISFYFLNQNGNKTASKETEKTYTLTGILKNKKSNITAGQGLEKTSLPAAFVCNGEKTDLGGKECLVCYIEDIADKPFSEDAPLTYFLHTKIDFPDMYAFSYGDIFAYGNGYETYEIIVFAVIIVLVLMIASCMGIISSFNSNLAERKKEIGMLRAVGATKKQIRTIFGREALIISLLCTPLNLAISYFIVKGIIKTIGNDFIFVPNIPVLIICGVFSVICVMIASLIPLFKASKITPVQAIRNIDLTRKMKTKHIKSQTEFNVPALLAKRNMTFGKFKQILVSVFLIISIIGSCFACSWVTYAKNDMYHIDSDYQLSLQRDRNYFGINYQEGNNGFSENDKQALLSSAYIESSQGYKECNTNILVDNISPYMKMISENIFAPDYDNKEAITKENYEKIQYASINPEYSELKEKMGYSNYVPTQITAFDSKTLEKLEKYVSDGKINSDKLNSGEEVIVIAPEKVGVYTEPENDQTLLYDRNNDIKNDKEYFDIQQRDLTAGEEINLSTLSASNPNTDYESEDFSSIPDNVKENKSTVKIGAIIDEFPENLYSGYFGRYDFKIITSIDGLNKFAENIKYKELKFHLNQECNDEIDSEIQSIMNEIITSVDDSHGTSEYQFQKDQKNETRKIFIAMIAVIILFFAICASIINNTLTASIRESKKEIGTLRAVGASEKELVNSYVRQLFSMFIWGLGIGFGGFFISYAAIIIKFKTSNQSPGMIFNPWVTIGFCLILFAICSINLWLKIRKEMKNSIVENIREL